MTHRNGQEATLDGLTNGFDLVLILLGTGLIIVTGLSRLRTSRWWVRAADFPRLQIGLALAVVTAAVLWRIEDKGLYTQLFAAALVLSLAYQSLRIFPYTPVAPHQVRSAAPGEKADRIRILISNVLMENRNAQALLDLIEQEQPDLVLTVETDDWWADRLKVLEDRYSFVIRRPQDNYYGLHFFSRIPVAHAELRHLVADDVPSVKARLVLPSGEEIDFHGLHPRPPVPHQDSEERDAEILIIAEEVAVSDIPAIVAGDLNDVAWSRTTRLFQRLSGLVDPRRGRGMFSSFHANYPLLRWPLDHVFHDARFTLVTLRRLPSIGSDHFPILVELKLEPERAKVEAEPEPLPGDRQDAEERIREGLESQAKPAG
jgi:endonuclease/exonuclease/phosphatase (EEP) superfamily protein YafD